MHGAPSSSVGHSAPGHAMGFAQAGATLAAESGLLGTAFASGAASSQGHGQPPSSQGHSNSSHSHGTGSAPSGSSASHAHMSSPTSSTPPHAPSSSDYGHTTSAYTHTRTTPPSSHSQHQLQQQDGRASPKPPSLMWRLRGGRTSTSTSPPSFDPGALQAPTTRSAGRPPSSLLNPPSGWGDALAVPSPAGWRPPPLLSPALSTDSDREGVQREGLLRPGLAVLLPPSHSTRSLGDDVDYSRPIAVADRTNLRMESSATFVTMTSGSEGEREDAHAQMGEVGEWPLPPPPGLGG
ncbi:hypothetical protein K438DRAFT_1973286 [Mycena galopus ATCC 62051]|nr:hypothetical protein K438DRAFT_1973286 [Mycena galopus ATCC 62051]